MVVECTSVDDLVAVLHEGNKNRRSGCHEMNKDSSRSHSLLHVYIISEFTQNEQVIKRYGILVRIRQNIVCGFGRVREVERK